MTKHKTLFLTQRGLQHQQWAMEAAPPELDLIMRRGTDREELLALLADAEFLISERTGICLLYTSMCIRDRVIIVRWESLAQWKTFPDDLSLKLDARMQDVQRELTSEALDIYTA